jgi:hypothetical protein
LNLLEIMRKTDVLVEGSVAKVKFALRDLDAAISAIQTALTK